MAAVGRNRSREARDRRRNSRRELFVSPALIPKCSDVSSGASGKHKGVLSDSENEEPLSRKIRNISAFIRKTKHSAACMGGAQRSQSCSDPLEDRAGKLKALQPPLLDRVSHSFTAGILLASENSRCSSAPPPSDRRLPWRPVLLPSSSPPIPPERSVSPDSNDSISEELNHFKPIECSPCTPPRRLADGRLVITSVVKSTPRNLNLSLNQNQDLDQSLNQNQDQSLRPSRYEVGAALMQKWRQIELDRQKMKLNGNLRGEETPSDRHGNKTSPSDRPGNKRLEFDPQDAVQRQKIHIPAVKERSSCRKRAFSPVLRNSRIQTRKLDQNQKESEQRGRKSQEKTRHVDLDQEKTWHLDQEKTWHLDLDQEKTRHLDLDQEKTRHLDLDQEKTRVQDQKKTRHLDLEKTRHLDQDQEKTRHLDLDPKKTWHLDLDQEKTRHLDLDQEKTRHLDLDQEKTRVQDQKKTRHLDLEKTRHLDQDQEKTRHLDLDPKKTRHLDLDQEKTRVQDQDREKTRHLDLDQEKTWQLDLDQEKTRVQDQDRVLALRLQRQFDLETSSRPEALLPAILEVQSELQEAGPEEVSANQHQALKGKAEREDAETIDSPAGLIRCGSEAPEIHRGDRLRTFHSIYSETLYFFK
ncbi:hypothetical protein CesoFtcFv8_005728 [Champsocephalus esox]|uniref:Uncharacterized protein n=1 Tax=Champsocephalus esox TaxID=159716 RepID=A0AAN8CHT7_9TELE|nr:hypothetical protein CesoFtcFv8_005728 [Champsocephalus esox]